MKTVFLISNTSWSIFNFRSSLVSALSANGYRVVAVAPHDAYSTRIAELGCTFLPLPMDNKGRNPFRDVLLLIRLVALFIREKPVCLLTFTIKPNIYGSIAARFLGLPVVNNIAGLGSVFVSSGPTQSLVRSMYRAALSRSIRVFFQNQDDHRQFVEEKIVKEEVSEIVPGSGVNTSRFSPRQRTTSTDGTTFLFVGRLLREKGVPEFVEAARAIRLKRPTTRFQVLGFAGVENPSAIQPHEIRGWEEQGVIENLGETDDVRPFIANADCIVLPSYYREGVPRSLLEAASMERPIIATDMPGCRETVLDGISGYLVQPKSVADLEEKMTRFVDLPIHSREEMGRRGRLHVQTKFDEQVVISRYLSVITAIAPRPQC